MKKILILLWVIFATSIQGNVKKGSSIVIDPWIREVPPVSKTSAAYAKIKNPTNKAIKLVGVKSDLASNIELHTHKLVDGVMRMRKVPHINIPAQGEVHLKPGGLHIMFFGLKKKTIDGQKHMLEFVFSDRSSVKSEAVVK